MYQMITSNKTNAEMATVFNSAAKFFAGLDKDALMMSEISEANQTCASDEFIQCNQAQVNDACLSRTEYPYHAGIYAFAIDLGFRHEYEIDFYFRENPKIWGNLFGKDLFMFDRAYLKKSELLETVLQPKHIARKFRQVARNLLR